MTFQSKYTGFTQLSSYFPKQITSCLLSESTDVLKLQVRRQTDHAAYYLPLTLISHSVVLRNWFFFYFQLISTVFRHIVLVWDSDPNNFRQIEKCLWTWFSKCVLKTWVCFPWYSAELMSVQLLNCWKKLSLLVQTCNRWNTMKSSCQVVYCRWGENYALSVRWYSMASWWTLSRAPSFIQTSRPFLSAPSTSILIIVMCRSLWPLALMRFPNVLSLWLSSCDTPVL